MAIVINIVIVILLIVTMYELYTLGKVTGELIGAEISDKAHEEIEKLLEEQNLQLLEKINEYQEISK